MRRVQERHATWLLLVTGGGPTADKPEVTFEPPADPDHVSHGMTLRVADCRAAYAALTAIVDLCTVRAVPGRVRGGVRAAVAAAAHGRINVLALLDVPGAHAWLKKQARREGRRKPMTLIAAMRKSPRPK
jgi:hypothetical protein